MFEYQNFPLLSNIWYPKFLTIFKCCIVFQHHSKLNVFNIIRQQLSCIGFNIDIVDQTINQLKRYLLNFVGERLSDHISIISEIHFYITLNTFYIIIVYIFMQNDADGHSFPTNSYKLYLAKITIKLAQPKLKF
jgi:hypothetical protein